MDVAGPLIPAKDIGGLYARWMLVGTLTWAVPAESDKLKVPEVPDAEGDEPQNDINPEEPDENQEEEKALKDKEGEEGKEEGDEAQVRVWEEEEEEKGEKEGEKDPALPGEVFLHHHTFCLPLRRKKGIQILSLVASTSRSSALPLRCKPRLQNRSQRPQWSFC